MCAGHVGCHDMDNSLSLRLAVLDGRISADTFHEVLRYHSTVELFDSGAKAANHGLAEVEHHSEQACRTMDKIERIAKNKRTQPATKKELP